MFCYNLDFGYEFFVFFVRFSNIYWFVYVCIFCCFFLVNNELLFLYFLFVY